MASPRPKPALSVVREGNPGHRPVKDSLKLPPADLIEPDWSETFDGESDLVARCRLVASREWARIVPVLKVSAGLAAVDTTVLHDYCVCVARIDQCERDLSRNGLTMLGERGWQKNGATTIVSQYRAQLKAYIGELGLSPSARVKLPSGGDDGDDDPFD
jgi:P27 family predicted phage terminase small subunit